MTCAKTRVVCTVIGSSRWVGTNDCANPQQTCPREPGEGYDKCKSICGQYGHAEEMAIRAGAKDGTAYIQGINWICRKCMESLIGAGVRTFVIGAPPNG